MEESKIWIGNWAISSLTQIDFHKSEIEVTIIETQELRVNSTFLRKAKIGKSIVVREF